MTVSERVLKLEAALAEAQTLLREYQGANFWRKVQVGDTWLYVPNYENGYGRAKWLLKVAEVNRKEDWALFESRHWSRLSRLESSPKWVLVGREFRNAIVARALRDLGYTFESVMECLGQEEESW
jgi:predicted RNA-binding protein with PUA-like domain